METIAIIITFLFIYRLMIYTSHLLINLPRIVTTLSTIIYYGSMGLLTTVIILFMLCIRVAVKERG